MDSRARMFKNYNANFQLACMDFFSEMIPEVFYMPEYLMDLNNLRFYENCTPQKSLEVERFDLPSWAENDPRFFTLSQRKLLESIETRKKLAGWIDLIFGNKQSGEEAVRHLNVFRASNQLTELNKIKLNSKSDVIFIELFEMGHPSSCMFNADHPRFMGALKTDSLFANPFNFRSMRMKPLVKQNADSEESSYQ